MRSIHIIFVGALFILLTWSFPGSGDQHADNTTEEECARLEKAEIIWHLSEYRWLCCIPKNEDEYETCIPIRDMQPLPKTSIKPFPPAETQTLEKKPQKP